MLLWGVCTGDLLWGVNLLWGGNVAPGRECCSGEGMLLWGVCTGDLLWRKKS